MKAAPSCVWKSASRIIPHANVYFVYRKISRSVKYNLIYQAISGSPRFIEIVRRRDGPRNWRPCARCYNVDIYFGDIVNLIIYLYLSMHVYENKRKITLALYFCDILRFLICVISGICMNNFKCICHNFAEIFCVFMHIIRIMFFFVRILKFKRT